MRLIFVHGWSVTNTDTYGELPAALSAVASRYGLELRIQHLYLGNYVSFHDEVTLDDIARALNRALRDLPDNDAEIQEFSCITHSTGGPVVRHWVDRYYGARKLESRIRRHSGEVSIHLVDQTDPRHRVIGRRLSQRAGHDHTGPVHAEMELPPAASPSAPMFRRGPLTFADDGQSGAVNDEVQAGARAGAPKREGAMLTASRERGVIGGREIDAQHPEDRGQEALGLPQRYVEDETERQGGFDGEIGILELPAPPADASRCPRGDRVRREPEGDVASPHEGSVVLGPVPDAIRCRVLRMHSRLHIEIMTRRRSRWSTCRPLLAPRAESAHQRR